MKYIHMSWLKSWLKKNKKVKKNKYHTVVLYTAISWELWKVDFPVRIRKGGKITNLLTYHQPDTQNYIVFETLQSEAVFEQRIKVYHTMEFHKLDEVAIGRRLGTHVRISDVTISRLHWFLKIVNGDEIWIQDLNSRFGSLALVTETLKLELTDETLCLQVGRSFFKIKCRVPSSVWGRVFLPKSINYGHKEQSR